MTEKEIISGNKLIADFDLMDGSVYTDMGWLKACKYHTSWDWLIPVAKKCIDTHHDNGQDIFEALHKCDIETLHKAIVEFIKWYNEKKGN